MNDNGRSTFATVCRLALAVGALAVWQSAASAQPIPIHKYTFNDNTAMDSIGAAHGTVVDNTGISTYTGGALDLRANNGAGSGQDFTMPTTVGAFVNLPNGIFSSAVNNGTFGAASLEMWLTTEQNRNWAEAFVFGNSEEGEDIAGVGASYVALIPQSGIATPDFRATTRDEGSGLENPIIGSATPLPAGVKQHVVLTLDHLDNNAGANPNGTARLYLNGGEVGTAEIAGFLDSIDDNNNWLGRSQWGGDPLYDGTFDEFRIYDYALSAGEVTTSDTIGPDPAPFPTLVVNRDTGAITVENQTAGNIQLKGYSINSAGGGLNPATWSSINTGNTFDPNGTWTAQSSTDTELAESVTGGTLDGGTMTPGAMPGVGTPWRRTPIEDVTFSFTLGDNSTGNGLVQYVGTQLERSDFNADGLVNVDDWSLFLPHSFTTFPGETAVGAYLKGDLDGDLDNDYDDFQLFKFDFIAANGAAAFAQLVANVPEPSALALLTAAMGFACFRRRSK